jgi:hypothetical protein
MQAWIYAHPGQTIALVLLAVIAYSAWSIAERLKGVVYDIGMVRADLRELQETVSSIDLRAERVNPERMDWHPGDT